MIDQQPEARGLGAFLKHDWPYIAMLILALLGVALASIALDSMSLYWEILVPFFAGVCVYTRLRDAQHQAVLSRLLRIEAFHWGAVIIAMWLMLSPAVSHMMDANATGLVMMTILALGTFTAGAQIGSWRIELVGAVLALAVPFVAWLERATLLVTLVSVAIVGFIAFYVAHHRPGGQASPHA
jgi:hypothetical protein